MIKGNYKLRFTPVADAKGNGGNWEEALVGNVGLYYKENPLAFKNANTVPEGWKILDAGQKVAAGAASLGPRIFQFSQGGYLPTGLYIRQSVRATLRRPLMPRWAQSTATDFHSKREAIISATTPSDGLEIPM